MTEVWMPVLSAGTCRTTTIDARRSGGSFERIAFRGSIAPADPPMTTRSLLGMAEFQSTFHLQLAVGPMGSRRPGREPVAKMQIVGTEEAGDLERRQIVNGHDAAL